MPSYVGSNEVSKRYVGFREVIKVYQGSDEVWNADSPIIYGWHVDPAISDPANAITYLKDAVGKRPANITKIQQTVKGYRDIEYLETTGTQMIVTDFGIPNFNYYIEVDIDGSNTLISTTGYPSLFGIRSPNFQVNAGYSGGHPNMSLAFYAGYEHSYGLSDYSITTTYFTGSSHKRATIRLKRGNSGFIPQDTTYPASTVSANDTITEAPDVNTPICFMGLVKSGGAISPFDFMNVTWYGAKVYNDSDVLVHNLIPVERITDNELGLVDTITGKFYSNAGTGTFNKGSYINTADYWFDYGSWANAFFMPKPCMLKYDGTVDYYLDESDYSKKKDYDLFKTIIEYTGDSYSSIKTEGWLAAYKVSSPFRQGRVSFFKCSPNKKYKFIKEGKTEWFVIGTLRSEPQINSEASLYNVIREVDAEADTQIVEYTTDSSAEYIWIDVAYNADSTFVSPTIYCYNQEDSDISNTSYNGNAMMEWPLIWYKFEAGTADGEGYFYCSDKQVDESYKCWCNINANNETIPHFYTAIYNGCIVSQKLRSLSGQALNQYTAYEVSFSDFVDKAAANNAGANKEWDTDVYADRALINALLVLISKTLNTQSAFGKGLTGGRPPIQRSTGRLDANGLFYGESTGNEFVKVFGMENYWGCLIRRTRGLTAKNGKYLYKLTRGTADGSSAADYNLTGDNYIEAFAPPPGLWEADAEISSMRFGPYGMLPQSSVRNSSFDTFYCDKLMPVTIETLIAQGGWTSGTRQSPSDTYYPLRVSSTDKRWIAGKGQYIFDAPDADSDVQIAVQLFDGSTRTLDTGWHTLPFALDLTAFYGPDYIVLFKKTDDSAIVPSDVGISVHKLTTPVTVGFGGHITRGIDAGAFELWPTDVDSLESLYGAALSCKPISQS